MVEILGTRKTSATHVRLSELGNDNSRVLSPVEGIRLLPLRGYDSQSMKHSRPEAYIVEPPNWGKRLGLLAVATAVLILVWLNHRTVKAHDQFVNDQLATLVSGNETFQRVTVSVKSGEVSVGGLVATVQDKQILLHKISETSYVRKVHDQIVVDTPWRPDRMLRKHLYEQVQSQQLPQVGIKVKKGMVTVTGEIGTLAEHDQLFLTIATARGVRGVSDQTTVHENKGKANADAR